MPILPYDATAAQWHGRARAVLEAQGLPTPFTDGQIAEIGGAEGLTVVTENTSDFKPFANLEERTASEGDAPEEASPEGGIRVENWFES